jgi:hypothetical protein
MTALLEGAACRGPGPYHKIAVAEFIALEWLVFVAEKYQTIWRERRASGIEVGEKFGIVPRR